MNLKQLRTPPPFCEVFHVYVLSIMPEIKSFSCLLRTHLLGLLVPLGDLPSIFALKVPHELDAPFLDSLDLLKEARCPCLAPSFQRASDVLDRNSPPNSSVFETPAWTTLFSTDKVPRKFTLVPSPPRSPFRTLPHRACVYFSLVVFSLQRLFQQDLFFFEQSNEYPPR